MQFVSYIFTNAYGSSKLRNYFKCSINVFTLICLFNFCYTVKSYSEDGYNDTFFAGVLKLIKSKNIAEIGLRGGIFVVPTKSTSSFRHINDNKTYLVTSFFGKTKGFGLSDINIDLTIPSSDSEKNLTGYRSSITVTNFSDKVCITEKDFKLVLKKNPDSVEYGMGGQIKESDWRFNQGKSNVTLIVVSGMSDSSCSYEVTVAQQF